MSRITRSGLWEVTIISGGMEPPPAFQPSRSEWKVRRSKVEKDQVVSEGKSSLVQSHFAIGEEVAEGGRRVGAKFAPGIHNSPPPCQVVGCCKAVGGRPAGK